MKTILLIVALLITLMGCSGEGTPQVVTNAVDTYSVEKLFTVDSITVYRFRDGGRDHYFTNNGQTMTYIRSGKTSYPERVN